MIMSYQKNIMKFEKQLKIESKKNLIVNLFFFIQWVVGQTSRPLTVFNEKYLKPKIKFYSGKINRNFHNNKIPTEGSQFIFLALMLIDSVFRTGNSYYSQVLLEEYKYIVNEKKMPDYITDDNEITSDSDREDSDEENYNEEN